MPTPVLVGIVLVVLLVVARRFAARRLAGGDTRFMGVLALPSLLGAVVILWAAIQLLVTAPLVGLLLTAGAVGYLGVLGRFFVRAKRGVDAPPPGVDLSEALTEPLADYVGVMSAVMLVGGLVVAVVLVIWGLATRAG